MGAAPLSSIIIPFTPVHDAVLAIAPKFLTSFTWSKSKIVGFSSKSISLNNSSIVIVFMSAILANTP